MDLPIPSPPPNMKTPLALLAGAVLATHVSAQSIVESETLVQSLLIPPFTASGSYLLTFDQFDTLGGTRTLTGVNVSFTFDKTGGSYAIDNDSTEAGTITFYHELRARLVSPDVHLGSASNYISALSEFSTSVGADNGDPQEEFNTDIPGADYVVYTPSDLLDNAHTATITPTYWAGYTGGGTYDVTFQALQSFAADGVGGLQSQTISSVVSATVTVVYTYEVVPEPQTALLGAVGMFALLNRRRRNL